MPAKKKPKTRPKASKSENDAQEHEELFLEDPRPERPAKKSHDEESEKTNEAIFGNL